MRPFVSILTLNEYAGKKAKLGVFLLEKSYQELFKRWFMDTFQWKKKFTIHSHENQYAINGSQNRNW